MVTVGDSSSLASIDALSIHNVDALSRVDAHNRAGDMNTGGHTKLIRLDKNQKRESRFWRKQRVREKKQRKWEEQVRKQQEAEVNGNGQTSDGHAVTDEEVEDHDEGNEEGQETENEPAEDSQVSDEEVNDSRVDLETEDPGDKEEVDFPTGDGEIEDSPADSNRDVLYDSGYKADSDIVENNNPAPHLADEISEDEELPLNSNKDADDDSVEHNESEENSERGEISSDEHIEEASDDRRSISVVDEDPVSNDNDEQVVDKDRTTPEDNAHSEEDETNEQDEVHQSSGDEAERASNKAASEDELSQVGFSGDEEEAETRNRDDVGADEDADDEDDDEDVVTDKLNREAIGNNVEVYNVSEANGRSYERSEQADDSDDGEVQVSGTRGEAEAENDSNASFDGEVQAQSDGENTVVGDVASNSDWVGPRSVSPYMEQQNLQTRDDENEEILQKNDSGNEGRESASDGDAAVDEGEPDATESVEGSSDQKATRPPSRVSLVYTYASGPKVLSHVELAPDDQQHQNSEEATVDNGDKTNGKHVTFGESVSAAGSVRLRRRKAELDDDDAGAEQMKEIRKRNKERRKNRVSNSFRSSSTSGSLMNDKRLIKTGNIGTLVLNGQPQGGPSLTDIIRYQEARRRDAGLQNAGSRRITSTGRRRGDDRVRTPPAVSGRKHYRVQTEPYLEEIRDRRLEADIAVQTDPMVDRPSTPQFVPSKTGADVATQIYEGDLFDFELEAAPILEVLVGKTVEQSLLEVMEEEELETLKEHQRRFQERRQAEVAEQQRLGERERRHVEEKERRMAQRRTALEQEQETSSKVAASALAQNYLADLVPAVFSNLRQKGFFFNGVERDIETGFMPWLRDAVQEELDKVLTGKDVLDELILDAVRKRRDELERRPSLTSRLPPPPPVAEPEPADEEGEADAEDEDEGDEEGLDEDGEEEAEEADTDDEEAPPAAASSATERPAGEEAAAEQEEEDS